MIAVTFALPNESSNFVRLLQRQEHSSAERTISGTLRGKAVCVLHTGVGHVSAQPRIGAFLEKRTPRLLISCGFAGALTDDLCVADLFLAENFSNANLLSSARKALSTQRNTVGKLATVVSIADESSERAKLARTTGAVAVDMETELISAACATRNIPMLSLRAISDTPAAPLGIPSKVLFDIAQQRTVMTRLGLHVLTHPRVIGRLALLAKQVKTARASLTAALARLFEMDL